MNPFMYLARPCPPICKLLRLQNIKPLIGLVHVGGYRQVTW
jgi:hypothetical protein